MICPIALDCGVIGSDNYGMNVLGKVENGVVVLEGKIKPIIAKTFPLAEAAQAQDFVSAGGMNGKVVLEVG